jgi:hypothetical protein
VVAAGGFHARLSDGEAAEACVDHQWLIAESETGYAITFEGREYVGRKLSDPEPKSFG